LLNWKLERSIRSASAPVFSGVQAATNGKTAVAAEKTMMMNARGTLISG